MHLLLAEVAVALFVLTAGEIGLYNECTLCEIAQPMVSWSGIDKMIEETLCPGEELVVDMNGDCILVTPDQGIK